MSIDLISLWHSRARPTPTDKDFNVQLGCHFEELAEMMECLLGYDEPADTRMFDAYERIKMLADDLKAGELHYQIIPEHRKDFLDSIGDQIVTATGVGHCAKMNVTEAVRRINSSNFSKYDTDGKPIFDKNGKVSKGPNYAPPDLEGLY